MVQINCPLCCNETFDSPSTLKSHLVDILENLHCPTCHDKFNKLSEFVEHLDTDCAFVIEIEDESIASPGSIEADDDRSELSESILARALLEGGKGDTELSDEQAQYYCQSCNAHFCDIDQHLNKFHQGQEIILEEETVKPADVLSEEQSPAPRKKKAPFTQDIKDKDGRLYTRKFVKIDKFWLQDELIADPISTSQSNVVEVALCQPCNTYFPTSETHECLENEHKELHVCDVCNTSFPSLKSLRLHRRMHLPIKTREIEAATNDDEREEPVRAIFVCKICKKTYDKEHEQAHMSSHEYNNGFNCSICNRKFYTKPNLEMHMKAHSNNKKFTCSYCKKPFVTYDALNEHLQNQCQKRPYACQYCGRRFTRPHEKVKHERIHTGEKPHVCEICGKAFRVSYCLTLHLRTHSGSRPYQCKHCGKRFKSHSVYNHHLLTHSDVRAYKCPYCPKAFKTSVQLAGHKNSHIKPFTCTECNRPFASLYAVRAHMDTHKRENNLKYECWICGALYSRAFALRDHLKQQHQQVIAEKEKAEVVGVDEEMEAANSILVNEDDIILGLEGTSIEIIENEGE